MISKGNSIRRAENGMDLHLMKLRLYGRTANRNSGCVPGVGYHG